MTVFDGYYADPLQAYLTAHASTCGPQWRTEALHRGLDLRPFKRSRVMPRIRAVLGVLKQHPTERVLDIGSGRGSFLWPALDTLPATTFVVIERSKPAKAMFGDLQRGGLRRVIPVLGDAERLCIADRSFPVTTMLEVFEHLDRPDLAARELARVTSGLAIVTVPSRPDDNPEHLRCYDEASLVALLRVAGFARVRIEALDGVWLAIALR